MAQLEHLMAEEAALRVFAGSKSGSFSHLPQCIATALDYADFVDQFDSTLSTLTVNGNSRFFRVIN